MVSSQRTSSWVAWVTVMPIALSQPSGIALIRSEKSWFTNKILAVESKEPGHVPGSLCRRSQCFRLRPQESGSEKGALQAHLLPRSLLANEAVGTTIRFNQGSAYL